MMKCTTAAATVLLLTLYTDAASRVEGQQVVLSSMSDLLRALDDVTNHVTRLKELILIAMANNSDPSIVVYSSATDPTTHIQLTSSSSSPVRSTTSQPQPNAAPSRDFVTSDTNNNGDTAGTQQPSQNQPSCLPIGRVCTFHWFCCGDATCKRSTDPDQWFTYTCQSGSSQSS